MSKIFCHTCGNKIEFTLSKPNFCFKCGESLNPLKKLVTSKVKAQVTDDEDDEEDEQDEEFEDYDFQNVKINLVVSTDSNPLTIGQIAGTVKGEPQDFGRPKNGRKALRDLQSLVKQKPQRITDD